MWNIYDTWSTSSVGEFMTWPEALQEAIDTFADVFDPMERYEMLFEWAAEVNELPTEEWNDSNIIHGCQSQAHVMCHLEEGVVLHARGRGCTNCAGPDGHHLLGREWSTPQEVADMEPTFVDEMGIKASLTPSRSNGFLNMFKRVQDEARSLTEGA